MCPPPQVASSAEKKSRLFLCATARVAGSPSRCFVRDQTHGCVRRRRWRRAQRKSHVFFYAPQREWQEARVAVLYVTRHMDVSAAAGGVERREKVTPFSMRHSASGRKPESLFCM